MADKTIADLPELAAVTDETLIPVWNPSSTDQAQSMTGAQFREFAEASVKPYSDSAVQAALTAAGCEAGAQQAWTGVQTAIKNIPSGSTPIVNDLTTGGTTMALSAEMGKLLGRRPNTEILDNSDFRNPINQRGKTEYTGIGYTIDRWRTTNANTTVTVDGDGITITGNDVVPYLQQPLEFPAQYLGCQCTLSALTKDGILHKATSTLPKTFPTVNTLYCNVAYVCDVLMMSSTIAVRLKAASGSSNSFIAAKLELGPEQTLCYLDSDGNWVLNDPPPHPQQKLAKCQRYQYDLGTMHISTPVYLSENSILFRIDLPVTMRSNPLLVFDEGAFRVETISGVIQEGFTFSRNTARPNALYIYAQKTSHGLSAADIRFRCSGFAMADANL